MRRPPRRPTPGDQFQREAVWPPTDASTRFRNRAGGSTDAAAAPIRVINSRAPRTPGTHVGQGPLQMRADLAQLGIISEAQRI
jgi:hypothetical protein